ncbi:hypothetical protein G6F57_006242 [Rhizopus arrhizus]|uniref:DNA endonuclease activator Ctp1 C-terminal domain-containing protein n=1 Tax=Rhizopus oryzae TaxID=64495 RepID=A0A9P6XL43_RHIOR|nr:hypothetical protein G6F23_000559 [Rhizopus arrhizus]KAG0767041.1 hypothetical protein G6F24_003127 [Rhizopus arrhizus]KAG0796843.1 hypothetical protein G6F22_004825 [Rhizopus arrhizus]KAG0797707.1 hypothetical protein G6F21_000308 [Rhizopus arrhizus]KAG0819693.1 hypothetical protein G6F20_000557 [Rhizopus arrhizus]
MSSESEVIENLKKNLNRERITVRLQKQNIAGLETKLKEYHKRVEKYVDNIEKEETKSKLINEQSKQRINQLESVIQENEQQIRMLRDTIQGYEKQSAEEHQEIYRLQDVVKQLQALLTEKSNLIDTQALSILMHEHQIQQLQQKKGIASSNYVLKRKQQRQDTQSDLGKENVISVLQEKTNNDIHLTKVIKLKKNQSPPATTTSLPSSLAVAKDTTNDNSNNNQSVAVLPIEPTRTRHDRIHMHGETCISCEKFYDTRPLPDVNGRDVQYTSADRIQLHSRHRQLPRQRATTPPGFWDLEFGSPDNNDARHIRHIL